MTDEVLITRVEDGIGTVLFNRPDKKNALSMELLIKLKKQLDTWADGDHVKTVVFRGQGDESFSSGYDITAIPTDTTPDMFKAMKGKNPVEYVFDKIRSFPYPTIAMVNGYAFGAGLNLAICCDIRIGADDIRVGMPPAKLGIVYHPEGLKQFTEVMGMARAKEIFFTGRTYTGELIREMGLVDHLVSRCTLEKTVYGYAKDISANAPLALKGIKKIFSMIAGAQVLNKGDLEYAERLIFESFNSDDLKEGQKAFVEKRKPVFKGK